MCICGPRVFVAHVFVVHAYAHRQEHLYLPPEEDASGPASSLPAFSP